MPTDPKDLAARREPPRCWLCKKPIKGRVYYQAGRPDFPAHRNCRVEIRGPRRGD